MKRGNNPLVLCLFGILPVVWLGLLIAPAAGGGLPEILARFPAAMNDPFKIELCGDSLKTVLVLLCVYGLAIGVYLSSRRNYRRGEEHGSAKWGNARAVNKKYQAANPEENKILTQNVRMGFDGKKHRRSLNTVVVGGSGAGKTRFYAKPNLCQAANAASHGTSYVVLDPKGEMLRDTGYLLAQRGYDVRVLDLLNMEKSHCYNPFVYLRDDNDVQRLVTNLFKSTTPKGSQSNDPFWDTAASMLLLALIFYLRYEAPEEEQNFPMVMELLRAGEVREDDDSYVSPLDELFDRLEMVNPEHIALKYYRDYHSGSAKTLKITLAARLEKFNLESLASLTATDELDLPSLGEKKVALFALIPDNDTSFNFLVSILYTQLFQQLFYLADHKYGGSLPVHCHFIMDEFANVSLPDDFDKILSVMRSREVSVSIILQNLAQLKALFEKQWESIVGNCDEFLYLGGNEQSTHKYVSELLGKETIDTNTYGKFAIGFTKEWAQKVGITPVIYIHNQSPQIQDILPKLGKNFFDFCNKNLAIKYIKPYYGKMWRNGKLTKDTCFYNEREWRFVPKNSQLLKKSTFEEKKDEYGYNRSDPDINSFCCSSCNAKITKLVLFFDHGTDRCIYRNNGCRWCICRAKQFKLSSDDN